jgi:hypothetical protein
VAHNIISLSAIIQYMRFSQQCWHRKQLFASQHGVTSQSTVSSSRSSTFRLVQSVVYCTYIEKDKPVWNASPTYTSKQRCNSSPLTTHLQNADIHFFPLVPLVRWSVCSGVGAPPGHLPHQLYLPDWSPDHLPLQTYTAVLPIGIKKHYSSENQHSSNATDNVTKHNINNKPSPDNSIKKSPSSESNMSSFSQEIPPWKSKDSLLCS